VTKSCLSLRSEEVYQFPDLLWFAVDIGIFDLEPEASDAEITTELLANARAAYSYIAPRPNPELDGERVHGPYVLDRLGPDSFEASNAQELWSWLDECSGVWIPPRTRSDLGLDELLEDAVASADRILRLKEDPSPFNEIHRTAHILGMFAEFLLIGRSVRRVLDIITWQD
jgi:hypothetical protein